MGDWREPSPDNAVCLPYQTGCGVSRNRCAHLGVHKGHRARKLGLSPFLNRWIDLELLGYVTIELEGDSGKPLLTRAYGGDYTPPLPWMSSAQDAIGGRAACRKYWTTHAYLNRSKNLILPGTQTSEVPSWYGTE
jgi:hypothetical protein